MHWIKDPPPFLRLAVAGLLSIAIAVLATMFTIVYLTSDNTAKAALATRDRTAAESKSRNDFLLAQQVEDQKQIAQNRELIGQLTAAQQALKAQVEALCKGNCKPIVIIVPPSTTTTIKPAITTTTTKGVVSTSTTTATTSKPATPTTSVVAPVVTTTTRPNSSPTTTVPPTTTTTTAASPVTVPTTTPPNILCRTTGLFC